ncbi:MAG: hypothetical protein M1503_01555 [Thaumarchaeota archaeon]|nr:hypothetical protein [Nitrososphaerota archaeon]
MLWIVLFPLLVMVGNVIIIMEGALLLLNLYTLPWLSTFLRYVPSYTIMITGILLIARWKSKKGIAETIKYLGWPYDRIDAVIAFAAGTVTGFLNVFLILGVLLLQVVVVQSLSVGFSTTALAVALAGPPEELARCYIQKNLAGSIIKCRNTAPCKAVTIIVMTTTFGLTHEISRFVLNLGTGSTPFFSAQDLGWYIGGFVLASLYVVMKSWFANSVAHAWYNVIISFFLH